MGRSLVHPAAGMRRLAVVGALALAALAGPATAGAALPDNRGYELVSPPDKNGADVVMSPYSTVAARAGGGLAFGSSTAFGDAVSSNFISQYVSRRDGAPGTSGWSTHGISPRGRSGTAISVVTGASGLFVGAFTSDLTAGIYRSWPPLTDAPNVERIANYYRLRQLDRREPSISLLTDATAPLASLDPAEFNLFIPTLFAAASDDMSHVLLQSYWNLTGDGSFGTPNAYEYVDGVGLRSVGRIPPDGAQSCDDVSGPACVPAPNSAPAIDPRTPFDSTGMMSADGSRIAFQSPGGNVLAGTIYLRVDGRTTLQVNASEKSAPESPAPASVWAMSRDGMRVVFITQEGLVDGDDDDGFDVYRYDASAPAGERLTLLSVSHTAAPGVARTVVGASDNGHYVYFTADDQLVVGEPEIPPLSNGLFLWHDGQVRYIGQFQPLSAVDLEINGPRAETNFAARMQVSRVTPDGRHLLFVTRNSSGFAGRGGFGGYDNGDSCTYDNDASACRVLMLYSADTGRLACVSCNSTGVAHGDAVTDRFGTTVTLPTLHRTHALSDDGRRVFFNTVEALVPEDRNGRWDAYEYDAPTGQLHLLSTGKSPADSYFLEASDDGRDVFFATRERLVGWDVDDNYDFYDARVGGGLPEPTSPAPDCTGDGCRGAATAPPPSGAAGSAMFHGAGDAGVSRKVKKHAKRCRRGYVRKRVRGRVRCVKKAAPAARTKPARSAKGR